MATRTKANDFLRAMNPGAEVEAQPVTAVPTVAAVPGPPAEAVVPTKAEAAPRRRARAEKSSSRPRAELKHFGGYVSDDTNEKVAILRVRLKLDNSELIKLAIDELHKRHMTKRAFGDD
jgi:hypothetical protein